MKSVYEKPEIEVIALDLRDAITTSPGEETGNPDCPKDFD